MDRKTRALYDAFSEEGVEVMRTEPGRGTHVKVFCRYRGFEFFYMCSINTHGADQRAEQNRRADLRRIKRAIRSNNSVVLEKFKVKRTP